MQKLINAHAQFFFSPSVELRLTTKMDQLTNERKRTQLLVELANNLASEHNQDAWLDLGATQAAAAAANANQRQLLAAQLVGSLEHAAVLLAGELTSLGPPPATVPNLSLNNEHEQSQLQPIQQLDAYLKVSDNVHLAIRSVQVASLDHSQQLRQVNVSFPNEQLSLLGSAAGQQLRRASKLSGGGGGGGGAAGSFSTDANDGEQTFTLPLQLGTISDTLGQFDSSSGEYSLFFLTSSSSDSKIKIEEKNRSAFLSL